MYNTAVQGATICTLANTHRTAVRRAKVRLKPARTQNNSPQGFLKLKISAPNTQGTTGRQVLIVGYGQFALGSKLFPNLLSNLKLALSNGEGRTY